MKQFFYLLLCVLPLLGSSLKELEAYAVKHSTVIKQSQANYELSRLKHKESRVGQFGEVNLLGSYTHYNTPRTLAPLTPSSIASGVPVTTTKDIYSAGVTYNVPLFTGFAQTRAVEISKLAKEMADVKLKLTKEQLVYNVRALYLAVLTQKEILGAQKSYTKALAKLTKQIAYEVKIGKKAEVDLLKAKSDLRASQTQQEMFKTNIEITKATLSSLVGKDIGMLRPLKISVRKPSYSIKKLYADIADLDKVKVADMSLKKADKMIQKSKASKLPQVSLTSYYGKNYGEDTIRSDWNNETLWQVGVNVQYNLVDFGKRDIAVQEAKIAKMQAAFEKEQTLRDLKKQLVEAVEKIKQSYAQHQGNLAQYRLSQKSEKIERVRYENDAATLNDLLLAKGRTQLARAKVIESRYSYQKSKYYLEYILEEGAKQ